jgi:hypothetical protein
MLNSEKNLKTILFNKNMNPFVPQPTFGVPGPFGAGPQQIFGARPGGAPRPGAAQPPASAPPSGSFWAPPTQPEGSFWAPPAPAPPPSSAGFWAPSPAPAPPAGVPQPTFGVPGPFGSAFQPSEQNTTTIERPVPAYMGELMPRAQVEDVYRQLGSYGEEWRNTPIEARPGFGKSTKYAWPE